MKELFTNLSAVEGAVLLVSIAIVVAVAFVLIVSQFDKD